MSQDNFAKPKKFAGILARPILAVFVGLIIFAPLFVSAQPVGVENYTSPSFSGIFSGIFSRIFSSAIGWVVFGLNYIIATIFGAAIAIIAYFIEVLLQLNTHIVDSLVVQQGFQVSLAVANLGFVLAIIVIAIATILRYQTYGVKQILWKLVVAAVLVNFSLVIAGTILNFADQLSLYFLNQTNPASGGLGGFDTFATSLAGAFGPQRVFLNIRLNPNSTSTGILSAKGYEAFQGSAGQSFAAILTPLLNLFFPLIFLIIAVITLAGLWVMLLIRYVFLGILLILMPFAWLMWIFPVLKSHWEKWWHNFIKWTFFAPIVIFFLYLAILTANKMNEAQSADPLTALQGLGFQSSANNELLAGISNLFGDFINQITGTMLQMAIMIALVMGGLFAANSLGIMFAKTAYGAATSVTTGFGKIAGRVGTRVGTAPLRGERGRKFAERLQQAGTGTGLGSKILRGTGIAYGVRYAGRGLENLAVAGGEKLVDKYKRQQVGKTDDQLAHNLSTMPAPARITALETLREHGTAVEKVGIENLSRYMDEGIYKRYGQQNLYNNLTKGKGAMADAEAIQAAIVGDLRKLDETLKKIIPSINKSQIGDNRNLNDVFGGKTDEEKLLNKYQIRNLLTSNFALISSIIPKLNSTARDNFEQLTARALNELLSEGRIKQDEYKKLSQQFDNIIVNNTRGLIVETGVTPTTTPTATPTTGT